MTRNGAAGNGCPVLTFCRTDREGWQAATLTVIHGCVTTAIGFFPSSSMWSWDGDPHWRILDALARAREFRNGKRLMPVEIESFQPLAEEEFTGLRQQKARKSDPAMTALLAEVATGQPVRVPLVEGQSARGLRTAISRTASSRGMSVETVEGVASSRCGRPMSHDPARESRRQRRTGSVNAVGHRSAAIRTRLRTPRCGISLLEKVDASRATAHNS
jgi:hypothetical protein